VAAEQAESDAVARRGAVARAGHEGNAAKARAAMSESDAGVRAAALGALLRAGGLGADDLAAAIADSSPIVRRRACEVAAAAHGVTVDLLPLTADDDATVVEVAAWALGELDPPPAGATARLAELVREHPDALVREAAVAALGAIGDAAGLAAVLTATGDKATVRRRAVLALAAFDGPEVDAALERARDDRDAQVRQAAEDLLASSVDEMPPPGPADG
jgi:HEAT repeat protein